MGGFRRKLRGTRWAFVAASVLAAMSAGLSGVPMSADPLEALRLGGGTVVCCVVPGADGADEVAWAADAAELLSDYACGCASAACAALAGDCPAAVHEAIVARAIGAPADELRPIAARARRAEERSRDRARDLDERAADLAWRGSHEEAQGARRDASLARARAWAAHGAALAVETKPAAYRVAESSAIALAWHRSAQVEDGFEPSWEAARLGRRPQSCACLRALRRSSGSRRRCSASTSEGAASRAQSCAPLRAPRARRASRPYALMARSAG